MIKVNWKEVARSPGYISLKKAYLDSCNRWCSKKEKAKKYVHFKQIMGRALYFTNQRQFTNPDIELKPTAEFIFYLDYWERTRNNHNWESFYWYREPNFRKIYKYNSYNIIKNPKTFRKYQLTSWSQPSTSVEWQNFRKRYLRYIREYQLKRSNRDPKRKPRWSNDRKKEYKRIKILTKHLNSKRNL